MWFSFQLAFEVLVYDGVVALSKFHDDRNAAGYLKKKSRINFDMSYKENKTKIVNTKLAR